MQIRNCILGTVLTYIHLLVFCSAIAYSANWQKFGELPESPKFGKTDYFVDVDSIIINGNIRSVWLKSVFSKPQSYTQGKTYTDFLSFTYYNCSNKTQAITQIDVYSPDGELVGSEKQDINYVPIPGGSLDERIYEFVCKYKK